MTVRALLPIVPRQPSQGSRCVSVLRQCFPFAAVSSSQIFVPADLHAPRKVDVKNLAHFVVVSNPAEPVRPVAVIHK